MHLESHATPTQESPQQRRAILHRAIERGLESDELWKELAEVNLALGHDDEAVRCARRIASPATRKAIESQLERRGLIREGEERVHSHGPARPAPAGHPVPAPADQETRDARRQDPREPADEGSHLRDHVVDAVQFLFVQHMPWLCLLTTLAFPLIVGLGGFLTAGGSPFALAAIAAVPGIGVLAVVGAMGRRILVGSEDGIADVPELGALGALLGDALRFLADALLVMSVLLLPSVIALMLGTTPIAAAPGLLFGMFVLPMAWGLRQIRGDFAALSPVTLLRGVARGGAGYLQLAVLCWAMFAPAGVAAWAVQGKALWVHIAAIGPLVVLPLFVASRMLGTWFDAQRDTLAVVVGKSRGKVAREADAPAKAASPTAPEPLRARHPDTLRHLATPKAQRSHAPVIEDLQRKTAKPKKANPVRAKAAPSPAALGGNKKAPAPAPAPVPQAQKPAEPAAPQPLAIEGRVPRRPVAADSPDLSAMPGAVVVSGQERVRTGAAARTQ
ncbi:MAG: DUF4013 domain-containing protein [Planctomycetota bacterium]|nr:DUF4013 domain-containing protein [Planctomycetota bacterium]